MAEPKTEAQPIRLDMFQEIVDVRWATERVHYIVAGGRIVGWETRAPEWLAACHPKEIIVPSGLYTRFYVETTRLDWSFGRPSIVGYTKDGNFLAVDQNLTSPINTSGQWGVKDWGFMELILTTDHGATGIPTGSFLGPDFRMYAPGNGTANVALHGLEVDDGPYCYGQRTSTDPTNYLHYHRFPNIGGVDLNIHTATVSADNAISYDNATFRITGSYLREWDNPTGDGYVRTQGRDVCDVFFLYERVTTR